jgi:hypothetical protein
LDPQGSEHASSGFLIFDSNPVHQSTTQVSPVSRMDNSFPPLALADLFHRQADFGSKMHFFDSGERLKGLQDRFSRPRRRQDDLHIALQISFSSGESFRFRSRQAGHLVQNAAVFRQPRRSEFHAFRVDEDTSGLVIAPARLQFEVDRPATELFRCRHSGIRHKFHSAPAITRLQSLFRQASSP